MRTNVKIKEGGYADREARIDVRYHALVVEMDGCEVPVEITDVSREGFGLISNSKLDPGQEVWLSVSNSNLAPLRALIQWTRGNEAGGVFLDPVAL